MLSRRIPLQRPFPSTLTPFPPYPCSLSRASQRVNAFKMSTLQPLLQNTRVGHLYSRRFPPAQPGKSFAAYHIPTSSLFSGDYALFCATGLRYPPYFQELPHSFDVDGGVPPLATAVGGAMTGESPPPGRRRYDAQSPRWKSSGSLPKRLGTRSRP